MKKQGKEQKEDKTFVKEQREKIFNNIRVYIKHIHVRYGGYEGDSVLNPGHLYAVGATFESIAMVSTDVFWRPRFQKEFKDHWNNKLAERLSLKDEGPVHGLTLTSVDETPHDTHFYTIHQSNHPLSLFQPSLSTPWLEAIA